MESTAPYAISATDRSGLIVIVEMLFMSRMIMVSLIRLYMRIAINGPVQIDDWMVFVASVSIPTRSSSPGTYFIHKGMAYTKYSPVQYGRSSPSPTLGQL